MSQRFIGGIEPEDGMTLKVSIRTSDYHNNSDAILLWQGSTSSDNFISIGMKNGRIVFSWFSSFMLLSTPIVEPGTSKVQFTH